MFGQHCSSQKATRSRPRSSWEPAAAPSTGSLLSTAWRGKVGAGGHDLSAARLSNKAGNGGSFRLTETATPCASLRGTQPSGPAISGARGRRMMIAASTALDEAVRPSRVGLAMTADRPGDEGTRASQDMMPRRCPPRYGGRGKRRERRPPDGHGDGAVQVFDGTHAEHLPQRAAGG
jgi:hypothetical protein